MKLLTKELEKRFAEVGRQEDVEDPIVIAKYFHPASSYTFLATEYYPKDRIFFGYASVYNDYSNELGYTSLGEMERVRVRGLGVERDLRWRERPLSEAKKREGIY